MENTRKPNNKYQLKRMTEKHEVEKYKGNQRTVDKIIRKTTEK